MAFNLFEKDNIPYLLAPNLMGHSKMLHAFTMRAGGNSSGSYDSLNLALHVGDNNVDVIKNRIKVAKLFGVEIEDSVAVRQTHGITVQKVAFQDKGQGARQYDDTVLEGDALVTDQPGILLWCFFADCVPVLFYDPVRQVIASTHAGWRGTQARIAKETALVMIRDYGCRPENILSAIGPSLGPCCFEVEKDVANLFIDFDFLDAVTSQEEKYKIDLWQANRQAIMEMGIPSENISCSQLCTSCLSSMFFSFRAENGITGRFTAAIMLKP